MTDSGNSSPPSTPKPGGVSSAPAPNAEKPVADTEKHWLVRPSTIRMLWIIFIAILACTVLGQIWVHVHAKFGVEGTFGFNAWYGFGACVALIVAAKVLGIFIKRTDTYYGEQ